MKITLSLLLLFLLLTPPLMSVKAQQIAIKTNLLYDAVITPNIGVEIGTTQKQTVQIYYGVNPWKFGEHKQLRHWMAQGEYRWWFCHRFNGWFAGAHALGGQFNMSGVKLPLGVWPALKDHRYEGWLAGGGATIGYQWILSKHWNIETSLGVGYAYIKYKKYECKDCGELLKNTYHNYIGPTKVAVSLLYLF